MVENGNIIYVLPKILNGSLPRQNKKAYKKFIDPVFESIIRGYSQLFVHVGKF